jgi:hypothetical protein
MTMPDRRDILLAMQVSFFRCPNSSRVLMGSNGDDKVMCNCGRTNPRLTAITPMSNEVDPVGGHAHHVKRLLVSATVDEYLAAYERREAW